MCGRFTNTKGPEEIATRFGVSVPTAEGTRRYNVAPTEGILTVIAPKGERKAEVMRWDLVPSWSTTIEKKKPLMINARMESIVSSPAYGRLIGKASRRALIVADGYYEWLKPEKRSEPRQPFWFSVDDAPFAFAAVWTPARVDGQWLHSCALLTCDSAANSVAFAIHDRMPVVLADRDTQDAWLDPDLNAEDALGLCGPLPVERLRSQPASLEVNRAGVPEGPWLLQC